MTVARTLWSRFNLRHDQADVGDIDEAIRSGARAAGTNLWVLFFAILIASVGLNVNSTAVIIGAMLISPLMAPIVGIGYGAAIADVSLMRKSALTLLGFTVVSLLTSMLYFYLSPLDEPGAELLARTSPNLWDVLIAAFGGAAGMVAVTRRSFTNIAPGVAIATALMPPLCTVGFGLVHQRWDMAAGAAYLFVINSMFIASATLLVGKLLRLPRVQMLSTQTVRAHQWVIGLSLMAVLLPSIWLGYGFAQQEIFKAGATAALRSIDGQANVVRRSMDAASREISLVVIGAVDEEGLRQRMLARLTERGIHRVTLKISRPDAAMWSDQLEKAQHRDDEIQLLIGQVRDLQSQITKLQMTPTQPVQAPAPHHSVPHSSKTLSKEK